MSGQVTVTALYQYPVKSMRGRSVDLLTLDAIGPVGDRRFMLVDARGYFVSQRTQPALSLVDVSWGIDCLVLTAPGKPRISISERRVGDEPKRHVVIWHDTVWTYDLGDEAADYFSDYLGVRVRLVHLPDESARWVDPDYAPKPARVGLADGFPLLLASEESLADLNAHLDAPLPMNRFRPNVVVRGLPAWDEDSWRLMRPLAAARPTQPAAMELAVLKPCARCTTTTVDQQSGRRGLEPLRTMAKLRLRGDKVFFGQNLLHAGPGALRVGDVFDIVK